MGQQKFKIISGEPEEVKDKEERQKIANPKQIVKKVKITEKLEKPKARSQKYQKIREQMTIRNAKLPKEAIETIKLATKTSYDSTIEAHIAINFKPKSSVNLKIKPDKNLVYHSKIGKTSDSTDKIVKSFEEFLNNILKAKPAGKKDFLKSIAICSTQSPSVKLNLVNRV